VDPTGPIAGRFPLIARPRPACTPLTVRVARLCALADQAVRDDDVSAASAVYNQAALLASDCGLPDLARQWCHQHAIAHLHTGHLDGQRARLALEPVVNLARLRIRAGDGASAFELLDALYQALRTRTTTVIDSINVPADLTATDADHAQVRRWLWTVHLADGTRALTSAGHWAQAHKHVRRHRGMGEQMLDGRQVAVIARATVGDYAGAATLLETTTPGEPWQNAVTACLALLCRGPGHRPAPDSLALVGDRFGTLTPTPALATFYTRLGLSAIDAVGGTKNPGGHEIAAALIGQVVTFHDGHAARDVLGHEHCAALLTTQQEHDLHEILDACALGHQAIPATMSRQLTAALDACDGVLHRPGIDQPFPARLPGPPGGTSGRHARRVNPIGHIGALA